MAYGRKTGGRRKGTPNKTTIAREAEIAASGATPLEVMLANMRFYHQEAIELVNKLTAAGAPQLEVTEGEDGELQGDLVEQLRTILTLRKMAGEEAARAAPYVHPRVGYDSAGGTGDPDFVPLAERLAYYQREDDIKAAGANVVELKPPGDQ
jgi:hypothetical protein